jgi:Uma2 family endonuclease
MLLSVKRISVPPGQRVLLQGITWEDFEKILEELGEHRSARIAYDGEILEIMTPLPEHEDDKEIIGDLVKALLEELDLEFRSLGSTTFKNPKIAQGIEPDQCFYIQNESKIRGKKRIDLTQDPPPDLALEIDITSRTHISIYASLKVPELWRFEKNQLKIYLLADDSYIESEESLIFPRFPLAKMIPQYLEQSKTAGRNVTLRNFRFRVREQL